MYCYVYCYNVAALKQLYFNIEITLLTQTTLCTNCYRTHKTKLKSLYISTIKLEHLDILSNIQ